MFDKRYQVDRTFFTIKNFPNPVEAASRIRVHQSSVISRINISNVAEAQLELHRRNMEWCIGAIAQARNKHVDVEPELDYRPNIYNLVVTE